jgi:hypothetical protein
MTKTAPVPKRLTQALMAELFQTPPQNITLHLQAIYEAGELAEGASAAHLAALQSGGDYCGRLPGEIPRHH